MPAVMDRPKTIDVPVENMDMHPIYILFIFCTPTQNSLEIQPILEKALPELNRDKILHIIDELRVNDMATIMRDVKEVVEPFYTRLKNKKLEVRMDKE